MVGFVGESDGAARLNSLLAAALSEPEAANLVAHHGMSSGGDRREGPA